MTDDNLPAVPKKLAKVATNLVNKISKAVGTIYGPIHTKRIAQADAEARIIAAKADVEITDIQRRAVARWLDEEERRQENIEAITAAAIPHLKDDAKPEDVDEDWLVDFFEHAKKVSDKEMQSLWAKILAGQANSPGSFRKNVLQSVSLLEKQDADLFVSLCRFGFFIGPFTPVIFDTQDDIYIKAGLDFDAVSHLDDMGLITFNVLAGYVRKNVPAQLRIAYAGQAYNVIMPESVTNFPFGKVNLTAVGRQLAPLSNAPAITEFPEFAIAKWKEQNIAVTKL